MIDLQDRLVGQRGVEQQGRQPQLDLARTRSDYITQIAAIETKFGDFPLAALSDRCTRGVFKHWRDQLALKSRRQADYAWQVLALILAWGPDRGLITHNPCTRAG